jgi:cytidylate kinase
MADEKKTECIKVWLSEPLELELRRMADRDCRKLSEYICLVLRRHAWGHAASTVADGEGAIRAD